MEASDISDKILDEYEDDGFEIEESAKPNANKNPAFRAPLSPKEESSGGFEEQEVLDYF